MSAHRPPTPTRARIASLAWLAAAPLATLLACSEDGVPPVLAPPDDGRFVIELAERAPTVATVRWAEGCDHAERAWVEFGIGGRTGLHAEALSTDDGACEAVLVGMKADRTYDLRMVEQIAGEPVVVGLGHVTTGAVPAAMPSLRADVFDEGRATDGFLATILLTYPPAYVVLDQDGDYVWWYLPDEGYLPPAFRVQPSHDGTGVLFQLPSEDMDYTGRGDLIWMSWDGERTRVYDGGKRTSHDFVELPDGIVATLRADPVDFEGVDVYGDMIVELLPDGSERRVWTVWDEHVYDPDDPGPVEPGGTWAHANAIDYVPEFDTYAVSLCNFGSIVQLDRSTGAQTMVFGGDHSDFTDQTGDPDLLRRQHQFDVLYGGLLVHDNRDGEEPSRAVQYNVDADSGYAWQAWEYTPDPPLFDYVLGDALRLASGNTLVTWSTAGMIDEVTLDGELVWQLRFELAAGIGYVSWADALGVSGPRPDGAGAGR